jgi:hypothetical protein
MAPGENVTKFLENYSKDMAMNKDNDGAMYKGKTRLWMVKLDKLLKLWQELP